MSLLIYLHGVWYLLKILIKEKENEKKKEKERELKNMFGMREKNKV